MMRSKIRVAATVVSGLILVAACGPTTTSVAPASTTPATPAPTATIAASAAASPSPSPSPSSAALGTWRAAAPMVVARTGFDAVVLGDGTVLAVGSDFACYPGPASAGSEKAERYDPVADAWAEVPSLNKPRQEPATVVTPEGAALVIGGLNDTEMPFSSTKQFESDSGTWTDGPLMGLGRARPLAVTLPDGSIFVVSNTGSSEGNATSERLDPASGAWLPTAALPRQTTIDDMVALAGGTVLAVGTFNGDTEPTPIAAVYDPVADVWTGVQGLARFGFALVALPDGRALAIGGSDMGELSGGTGGLTAEVRRFEPGRGVWALVAPLFQPLEEPQVAVLPDGRVLVAGGATSGEPQGNQALRATELYDVSRDAWTSGSDLLEPRYGGHALVLADGSVLILGGANDFNTEGETPWCPTPLLTTERLGVTP